MLQKMISSVPTVCVLVCLSFLLLHVESQSLYAASLGGSPVGLYSREGGLFGDSAYLASLGGAPVGAYSRQQYPVFHPVVEVPVRRPRPRPPTMLRPVPAKPVGVSGRILGGLLDGIL